MTPRLHSPPTRDAPIPGLAPRTLGALTTFDPPFSPRGRPIPLYLPFSTWQVPVFLSIPLALLRGHPPTPGSPALVPGIPLSISDTPPHSAARPPPCLARSAGKPGSRSLPRGAPTAGTRGGGQSRARSRPLPLRRVQGAAGLGRSGPLDPNFLGRRERWDDRSAGGTTRAAGTGGRGAEDGPGRRPRKAGGPDVPAAAAAAGAWRGCGTEGPWRAERVGSAGRESGRTSRNSQVL